MQLIDKVIPTLAAIREWLTRLFAGRQALVAQIAYLAPVAPVAPVQDAAVVEFTPEPAEVLAAPADEPAPPPIPIAAKERRTKRSTTQVQPDTETFSALLEGLDDSFSSMQIPPIKGNWLPRKDISAIHKLGIYIPTPWLLELVQRPAIPAGCALPIAASCLMTGNKHDTKEKVHPRFAFALKEARLPENVEQIKGVPYRFGYCVQLTEKEHDRDSPPRLFWVWAWVVVQADGSLVVPHELRSVVHQISHRRPMHPGKTRGARQSSFVSRQWAAPTAFTAGEDRDQAEYKRFLLCVFRQLLMWWSSRSERWSVGVRKDGKRLTFSIDQKHTAAYFADRNKVASINGTAKKIIHYVRPHERSNGSTVKAHVRGLREFDWRGFHCAVTAPTLNGFVSTTADLTPVLSDESELGDSVETHEAANMLADYEDGLAA